MDEEGDLRVVVCQWKIRLGLLQCVTAEASSLVCGRSTANTAAIYATAILPVGSRMVVMSDRISTDTRSRAVA